jgi:glutathione peroxidase-family protein
MKLFWKESLNVNSGQIGVMLVYLCQLTGLFQWTIRQVDIKFRELKWNFIIFIIDKKYYWMVKNSNSKSI